MARSLVRFQKWSPHGFLQIHLCQGVNMVPMPWVNTMKHYENDKYLYIKSNGVVVILPLRTQVLKSLSL